MAPKSTSKTTETGFDTVTTEALQDGFTRAVEASKENLEAVLQSVTVASKGFASLNTESLAFAKQSVDDSVKAAKAILSAKTPQDFITLQSEYARAAFDQLVNQATKFNDLTQSMAKDSVAPFNGRFAELTEAAQKFRAV